MQHMLRKTSEEATLVVAERDLQARERKRERVYFYARGSKCSFSA